MDEPDVAGDAGFEETGVGEGGFAAAVLELPLLADGGGGAAGAACGPALIRSLGNRIPQNPTAGSVNSSST